MRLGLAVTDECRFCGEESGTPDYGRSRPLKPTQGMLWARNLQERRRNLLKAILDTGVQQNSGTGRWAVDVGDIDSSDGEHNRP